MVPFLGAVAWRVRAWWHTKFGCSSAHETTIYDVFEGEDMYDRMGVGSEDTSAHA